MAKKKEEFNRELELQKEERVKEMEEREKKLLDMNKIRKEQRHAESVEK